MINSLLNKLVTIVKLFKPDLHVKIGLSLLAFGTVLLSSFNLYVFYEGSNLSYSDNSSIVANLFGIIMVLSALKILFKRLTIEESKKKFIFYFPGMEFNDKKFPKQYIPRESQVNLHDVQRNIFNSYSKEDVLISFAYNKKTLQEQVFNKDTSITYLAGLGSFPHLFLSGYLFNSANASNIEIFDYDRDNKEWYIPSEFGDKSKYVLSNKNESLDQQINALLENNFDDVGIAISNSFPIVQDSIPEQLKEHTLFIEPDIGIGLNCCDNKETQASLLNNLTEIIAKLSNKKKKIHLFVSARASFCINLGTYYMPRTHSSFVLHNYNNTDKERDWFILLENGEVS